MSALSNYPRLARPISLPTKWNTWNLNNSTSNGTVFIGPDGFSISSNTVGTGLCTIGFASIGKSSGLWYWEVTPTIVSVGAFTPWVGIATSSVSLTPTDGGYLGQDANGWSWQYSQGYNYNGVFTFNTNSYTSGTVLAFALDQKNGFIYNGTASGGTTTWLNSGIPTSGALGTGAMYGSLTGTIYPAWSIGAGGNVNISANFGQAPFVGSVPANYVAGMY